MAWGPHKEGVGLQCPRPKLSKVSCPDEQQPVSELHLCDGEWQLCRHHDSWRPPVVHLG